MNKYVILALLFFLSSSASLAFILHNKLDRINELENTIGLYEQTIQHNNNTISLLEQDIKYTETILAALQEARKIKENLHKDILEEWELVKEEGKKNVNPTKDHNSLPPVVDLSEHFRLLKSSACNTNKDCVQDNS